MKSTFLSVCCILINFLAAVHQGLATGTDGRVGLPEVNTCTTPVAIPGLPIPPEFAVTRAQICNESPCQRSTCSPPLRKPGSRTQSTSEKMKSNNVTHAHRHRRGSSSSGGLLRALAPAITINLPGTPADSGVFTFFHDFVCLCDSGSSGFDCEKCITYDHDGDNSAHCAQDEEACGPYCFIDRNADGKSDAKAFICKKYVNRTTATGDPQHTAKIMYIYCSCCL